MTILIDHHFELRADRVETNRHAATIRTRDGWDAEERSRIAVAYPGCPISIDAQTGEMVVTIYFRTSVLITDAPWTDSTWAGLRAALRRLRRRLGR